MLLLAVALRARRSGVIELAILACAACGWLGLAPSARAAITSVSVGSQSLAENQAFNGTVATFTTNDALPLVTWAATIDWGDGTTTSGTILGTGPNRAVSGNHTYLDDGTYTLTVTVTETGGISPGSQSASASVAVAEADASLIGVAPTTIGEGTAFSGPVASVVDSGSPDPASSFSATIDWGDGTSTAGTISGSAGNFTISGSHTYADELAHGVIKVTASEPGANSTLGPVDDQITVTEADVLIDHGLTFSATDGVPFSGTVATFADTDSMPNSDFAATIDWGDGATSSGTVSVSGGTLTVSGRHTYNSLPGSYPINVRLSDDAPGTAIAIAASTAKVSAGKPSVVTHRPSGVTINGATLNGTVDPNGGATSYAFQYGTTRAYGTTTRFSSLGFGNSSLAVSTSLTGLVPGRTYHYRVLATSAQGTSVGADQTFTTTPLVTSLRRRPDGSVLVVVNAPGPGAIDVTVMAGSKVFGHARLRVKRAGRVRIPVRLNRTGRLLIKRHPHLTTLRTTLTFTPRGGRATTIKLPGPR